jgi:hypothetical protein
VRVDILKGWRRYTELMDLETDPKAKAMLHNMRLHHKFECLVDPAIFDTMVAEPEYRFHTSTGTTRLKGMKEVQGFYHGNWERGSSLVDLNIEHCATADWGVACDGWFDMQSPGASLVSQGASGLDPNAHYRVRVQMSWFFPYETVGGEQKLWGEICYISAGAAPPTKLSASDVLTLEEARASWPEDWV